MEVDGPPHTKEDFMKQEMTRFERALRENKCISNDHYLLADGKHSFFYFDLDRVEKNPETMKELVHELVGLVCTNGWQKEVDVIVPVLQGAVAPAMELGSWLGKEVVWANKNLNDTMYFANPGNIAGRNVLLLEYSTTSGRTMNQLIDAVNIAGGNIKAIVAVVDRSNGTVTFGDTPFVAGVSLKYTKYDPKDCPLCRNSVKLIDPRKE